MQQSKTVRSNDPIEFFEWLEEIKKEINRVRGINANLTDIKREMVKQFKGKFIV